MESISAQIDTQKTDTVIRPLSAYKISLTQDTHVPNSPAGFVNPKAGDICPQCQSSKIDYDCLLNLSCPNCGYMLAGCST